MRVASISIEGFRGVKEQLTIEVPSGFLVVSGRNGAGKSTVCDAVEFALTGALRKYDTEGGEKRTERRETVLDYIWWRGDSPAEDASVGVTFEDGKESVTLVRHRDSVADEFIAGSRDFTKLYDPVHAPNDPISHICRTMILRDEEIAHLSVDLHPNRRFELLREAVATYNFDRVEQKISAGLRYVGDVIGRAERDHAAKQALHVEALTRLSEAMARLSSKDDSIRALQVLRDLHHLEAESIDGTLSRARERIAEIDALINSRVALRRRIEDLKSREDDTQREGLADKVRATTTQLEAVAAEVLDSQAALAIVNATLERARERQPLITSTSELHDIGMTWGLEEGVCRLCGSRVSSEQWEAHQRAIEARVQLAAREISDLRKARETAGERLDKAVATQARLQETVDVDSSRLRWIDAERAAIRTELQRLSIDVTPTFYDALRTLDEQQAVDGRARESLAAELRAAQSLELKEDVAELDKRKVAAEESLQAARRTLSRLEDAREALTNARRSIRRTSGQIVRDQVQNIGPLLKELYSRIKPHSNWDEVEIAISGDVQLALGMQVGGGLNPAFMFSSGQRRAMGLAFLISVNLSRSWSKLQTQILDDPVQHIDDYRSLHLVETLAALRQTGRQIICTVEDDSLADLLCRRLRSKDRTDGKRIELEYVNGRGVVMSREEHVGPLVAGVLKRTG